MSKNKLNLIFVLVIIGFYFLISWDNSHGFDKKYNIWNSFYNKISYSISQGRIDLGIVVPRGLLELQDPYNPIQNSYYRVESGINNLMDLSLYKGKIYAYFGLVPAVIFYLPLRIILRQDVSDFFVSFILVSMGFIFNVLILDSLKRFFFPNVSNFYFLISVMSIGYSIQPYLLSKATHLTVPHSSAYFFLSGAIYFLFKPGVNDDRFLKLFFGGLFLSLTLGCKPNYLISVFFILLFYFLSFYKTYKLTLKHISCLVLPLIFVSFLIGLYNYLRFDNPFEFGFKYQLTYLNLHSGNFKIFDKHFVLENLYYYCLAFPEMTLLKPYIHPVKSFFLDVNNGHVVDEMLGLIPTFPMSFFWVVFLLFKRNKDLFDPKHFPIFVFLALTSLSISQSIFYLGYIFITFRYLVDSLPYFLILSFICWFYYEENVAGLTISKIVLRSLVVLFSFFGAFCGLCLSY